VFGSSVSGGRAVGPLLVSLLLSGDLAVGSLLVDPLLVGICC
jgi:hypothetical protein